MNIFTVSGAGIHNTSWDQFKVAADSTTKGQFTTISIRHPCQNYDRKKFLSGFENTSSVFMYYDGLIQ